MKSVVAITVLTGLLLLPASRASAQTDFSGTWTLDRDLSADLTKASFDPPAAAKPKSTGGLSPTSWCRPPSRWRSASISTKTEKRAPMFQNFA